MSSLAHLTALLSLAVVASTTELTPDNWDEAVAGKSVFIKFLAPWCGHCKKLKPDWDKLMEEFKDSKTVLIADVDCTTAGKALCSSNGVRGYPSIKYGDPNSLEDYKGGRTLDALKKFAAENLGPTCSPANIDLCDEEKKALIMKFQAMSSGDLDTEIKNKEAEQEKTEQDFTDWVEGLNKQYKAKSEEKEAAIEAIKSSGLGMMKAVQADAKKKTKQEL